MRKFFALLLFLLPLHFSAAAKDIVPFKPNPPRLVNDYTSTLSGEEVRRLEEKLDAYSDSTSTQIAVVILPTLDGNDPAKTAYSIGDAWGVGGPKQDNGIVLLISMDSHDVFIATGKGTEGPIPDVTAKRIIETIIVPAFQSEDYYKGIDDATTAMMKLMQGEFVDELGNQESDGSGVGVIIFIVVILILISIFRRRRGGGGLIGGGGFFPTTFGGGSFGGSGGGGGFGGFGGGSFGGGGAGGHW